MDAAIIQVEQAPSREIIRDWRGVIVGVIERQRQTGTMIARDRRGVVVGRFDRNGTRTAGGRLVSPSNLLSALLLGR